MSDSLNSAPRPVSLVTIVSILGCFALFLLVAYWGYLPSRSGPAYGLAAEKLPEDQAWKSVSSGSDYRRVMELVARDHGAAK